MTVAAETESETTGGDGRRSELASHRAVAVRRRQALTLVALLVAPVGGFFGLRVVPYFVQNGVDPFIYVGYQQNLGDLIERFGYTYYFPVRFGLILPLELATSVFGIVPGLFVSRYVLALVAAVSLYALGRSHGSRGAGWVGVAACLCSPVFIGALMTTYADTVGVPCLIAGIALMLMPSDRARPVRAALAGLCFAVAFNTNLFVGPLLAAALACRAVLHIIRREWYAFVDWVVVGLAVVVVTALGALYYGVAFGKPDILTPSIDAARLYSGEAGLVFRSPTRAWLTFSPHLYIPALIGVALFLVIVLGRRSSGEAAWRSWIRPGAADALVMLGGAQLFFGIHQFLLDGYSMEAYYYYSFMWPFAIIALVMVVVRLADARTFGSRGAWLVATVPVLVPLAVKLLVPDLELWPSSAVPVLVGIVALGLIVARFVPWAVWVSAGCLVAGVSLLAIAPPRDVPLSTDQTFRWDPHYENMLGLGDHIGLYYYQAAAELADVVPKWKDDPGSNVYWYRNSDMSLNSIQASGLWRDATIDLGASEYPTLRENEITLLKGRTPRHVIVLGRTEKDVASGERALGDVLTPLATRHVTIGNEHLPVHVAILTYEASSCDQDWRARTGWAPLGVCR
jgi:hypothetical protein